DLGADPSPQPPALLPAGRGLRRRDPAANSRKLQRQAVLAVVVHDAALLTSLADGQLCRTFGTLGLLHDLLSQLAIAKLSATSSESLGDVGGLYLVAGRLSYRHRAGAGKPEGLGIEFEQSWGLGRAI